MNKVKRTPKLNSVYEYADADGNRGEWITYIECPTCGCELDVDEQKEQCECGQLIDWCTAEQEYE